MMFEEIGGLLNLHPLLWVVCGVAFTLPVVALATYFFWSKEKSDSIGHRKKRDVSSPDAFKDDTNDSGIETSGEIDRAHSRSDNRGLSPDSINSDSGPDTIVTATTGRSHDVIERSSGVVSVNDVVISNGDSSHGPRRRDVKKLRNKRPSGKESTPPVQNGVETTSDSHTIENGISTDAVDGEAPPTWRFPPILDEFNLMESDADPSILEEMFQDSRLVEVKFRVESDDRGVGISIVGGVGSARGDLPIYIKRVLPGSPAEQDGQLKAGDELVAVNETILVEVSKDFAVNTLSKVEGDVRLLVLQDE